MGVGTSAVAGWPGKSPYRFICAYKIIDVHTTLGHIKVFKLEFGCHLTINLISPAMDWGHSILLLNLFSKRSVYALVCNLKTALTFWGFC